MKKSRFGLVRIILIAVLSVVAILALAGFVACSDDESASDTRQVPIYQGMVISSANSATSYGIQSYSASGSIVDDNVSGDIVGREELVDENHPFGDDSLSIEQEIEKEFGITGVGQDIYYADKNEDVFVTVKFSNPNDFEILSFRINGQTYASYMFQDGSDMENIIIKLNVGSVAGFNEYEISEIKYVDGTEIKDVLLNGDTVVRCGVRGDEAAVAVSVANESVTLDEISFNAKITDNYSLIEESDGYAVAVLYDGSEIIASKDLAVGDNAVSFTKLDPNTLYQYAVVVVYDDLSGNGVTASYPYVNSVYTETLVLFDNVVVTKTSVSFEFSWYEGYDDNYLHSKFTLEGASRLFEEVDPTAREITGLLSDHEYTLNVAYTGIYGETEAIRLTFRTLAMDAPDVDISASTTCDSLSYTVSVTDTDGVGSISSVTVYRGGDVVYAGTDTIGTIDNLLSNNEYTLTVVYTYNLNDGTGTQTMEVSKTVSTVALKTPSVSISLGSDKTEIDYELTITDVDSVGSITSVTLSHSGSADIEGELESSGYFDNLLSNNEYTLTVVYTYDLNDGVGPQTLVVSKTISTQAMETPEVEITLTGSSSSELTFCVKYTDSDNVGSVTNVELYSGNSLVKTANTYADEMTFSDLFSYTQYTLIVSYTYDLNDGDGQHSETVELSVYTEPEIEFMSIEVFNTSAVSEGEEIRLRVAMNAPSDVEFTSVVINGASYEVSPISTSTSIYVNIVNDGQFDGGETELKITQATYIFNGFEYAIDIAENNVATVFVNGELYVESFSVVSLSDGVEEERLYRFKNEQLYYKIELMNATGYDIESVTIGGTEYSGDKITLSEDKQTAYVALSSTSGTGWSSYVLSGVRYGNDTVDKSRGADFSVSIVGLSNTSDDIVEITTAEELMCDMTGWKYYKLMNDIDLSGYEWINVGNTLQGVFDGNGRKITGLRGATTYMDTDVYLGLFDTVTGVVMNLEICEEIYMVTLTSADNSYEIYAGGLAAKSNQMIVKDCIINASFEIANETGGTVYIGALSGSGNSNTKLYSVVCNLSGYITCSGYNYYGYFGSGTMYSNSYSEIIDTSCHSEITFSVINLKDEYAQDGDFIFIIKDGAYSLVRYVGTDTYVVLPESINGNPYDIGDYAFYHSNTNIREVVIPDCVTSIGYYAFGNCKYLTSIVIPDSVTSIDSYAFNYCTSLISITIGSGVTYIDSFAFYNCASLSEITIPGNVASIGNYAFKDCTSLTTVIICDGVTIIGGYAFEGCASLTSISIADSVTTINGSVFHNCTSLTSIVIPDGVTSLGGSLFSGCVSLTNVIIPDSVTSVGSGLFNGCTSLTSVTIGNGATNIQNDLFSNCTSLTNVVIGYGIKYIYSGAFSGCESLTAVYYSSTASDWSKISIYEDNDALLAATVYYYSETEPDYTDGYDYWHYVDGEVVVWTKEN